MMEENFDLGRTFFLEVFNMKDMFGQNSILVFNHTQNFLKKYRCMIRNTARYTYKCRKKV